MNLIWAQIIEKNINTIKKQWQVILYFAISLFAIMTCEYITSIQATNILQKKSEFLLYSIYSFCVTIGVVIYYFTSLYFKNKPQFAKTALYIAIFAAAGITITGLITSSTQAALWMNVIALYLLAGFNTGIVTHVLYYLIQSASPIGLVLAIASLFGLVLHYILCMILSSSVHLLQILAGSVIVSLALLVLLLLVKIRQLSENIPDLDLSISSDQHRSFQTNAFFIGIIIALLSFMIGMSDCVVMQSISRYAYRDFFYYPVLFYIPGQVIACLIYDVKNGKYISLSPLVGTILLIPITLFLQEPGELYMNAGLNFFIGGFFLTYIMTNMVAIAHKAKNKFLAICLSPIIYSFFCGVGGYAGYLVIQTMSVNFIVSGFSIIVLLMAGATYGRIYFERTNISTSPPPAPIVSFEIFKANYNLTNRETEVLQLLVEGKSTAEIAELMTITDKSVRNYISSLMNKTGSSSRGKLIAMFTRQMPPS